MFIMRNPSLREIAAASILSDGVVRLQNACCKLERAAIIRPPVLKLYCSFPVGVSFCRRRELSCLSILQVAGGKKALVRVSEESLFRHLFR